MNMNRFLEIALGVAIASVSISASAATYKWTDESGRVHYSQTPPAGAQAVQPRASGSKSSQTAAKGNTSQPSGALGRCERGTIKNVRQTDLYGTWKQTGMFEDGQIQPLPFKIELTHEFRDDCTMIATLKGEPSEFQYSIEDGQLVLTGKLTGTTTKEFQRVSRDTLIYGGDVFTRVR